MKFRLLTALWGAEFCELFLQVNFYRAQCLAARAIFRIWQKIGQLGCTKAAELLAAAHYAGRLRRSRLVRAPATLLVPEDAAIKPSDW